MTALKRTKFLIALLAASAAGSLVSACDQCDAAPSKACKACKQCDDRGLLDVVDSLAGRVQSTIKSVTPSLPKVKLCICKTPQCTCRPSRPAHKGKLCDEPCGCDSSDSGGYAGASPIEHLAPTPVSIPNHSIPSAQPFAAPESQGHQRSYQPQYGQPVLTPMPLPAPTEEVIPLPDSAVDPFRDESANRVRRVPARTIQHSKPATRYGESYDPQAFNMYRVRLSDDMPAVRSTVVPRPGIEVAQSSRRSATRTASFAADPQEQSQAVVTANSTAPVDRSSPAVEEAPNYANPLR